MSEDKTGRELAPREPSEVGASDGSLTPVAGDNREVERFSAGPRAHSAGLTEERSAKIVRQSANARNVVFLAILLIALFIPVYWFYESGIPALGTEGRLAAEADTQYVTDVARGYELYLANCATCHGEDGQGGIGPRLNDQGKLYNVLTPGGDSGTGHLNPEYLQNVLNVGGRYVCGDPDSLMAAWQQPDGPLNYRQVEELIAWVTASQDVTFERRTETHGEGIQDEPQFMSGWRDPDYQPGPEDTPVPDCWKAPGGLVPGTVDTTGATSTTDGDASTVTAGGTPEEPRVIRITATASLQFLGEDGAPLTQIDVLPGETIEFVVDNEAGFDHNFYIGTAEALQVPFGETDAGIPTWQSGEQTLIWTAPESGADGLQFACTVPGHYQPMHGDIRFSGSEPAAEAIPAGGAAEEAATAEETATAGETGETGGAEPAAGVGTAEAPRVINLTATSSLQFLDESGTQVTNIDVAPGETIEFVVDNTAGFDHNFYIGTAEALQVPFGETDAGIPTWQTGEQRLTWTVPEASTGLLEFACTVPGHYTPMHGNIVIQG